MKTRVLFPGAWYGCNTPTGAYAVLYPDSHIQTSLGRVDLPAGGNVLFLVCAEWGGTLVLAGQGHQDGQAWLWNGAEWRAVCPTYGLSPCAFGPLGLYVSMPGTAGNVAVIDPITFSKRFPITQRIGSRGIAAVTDDGVIHPQDEWYGASGLAEFVERDGIRIGQGLTGGCIAAGYGELEPGNVQFVRFSKQADRLAVTVWKPDEKQAVCQVLTMDELSPQPKPATLGRFWLHPNIASADLLTLVDRPDLLKHVDVLGLYVQQILFEDATTQGPNTSSALIKADVYRKLAAAGVAINVEMGSVKPGDCGANPHNLEWMLTVVREHGGEIASVTQDEPLTAWIDGCSSRSIEQIADSVAAWMRRATELGVPHVGLAEAWPHVGFATQQQFLTLLQERGAVPSHWELDIDWHTAESQGKNIKAFIQSARLLAEQRGITLSMLVNSTVDPIPTDDQHFANLATLSRKIHTIDPAPMRVVVQSWARRVKDGPQTVPNNLGTHGLVASFTDTLSVFDALPTEPEPELPPEEIFMSAYGQPAPGYLQGKLEPHPDGAGFFAVRKPNGYILSFTPAGTYEQRPNDGSDAATYRPGPWERFERSKKGNLIAERDGKVTIIPFEE